MIYFRRHILPKFALHNKGSFTKSKNKMTYCFWALFILHCSFWLILPTIFQPNIPLDVCEGFVWGNEWPLGTYKQPPLQAWLLQIAYFIFGTSPLGFYGLSALSSGLTLWAVFRTGSLLSTPLHGLLAAALTQNIVYLNFLSTEFNPNVLQMLLAAIASYLFALALIHQKLRYWILLGVIFAASFYTKYSTIIQASVFMLFLVMQSDARKNLHKIGPYLVIIVCFILLSPHLIWLIGHNFLPHKYIETRPGNTLDWSGYLFYSFRFLTVQLADCFFSLIGVCILLYPLQRESLPQPHQEYFKKTIIYWLALAPILLLTSVGFITKHQIRDMYGMPFLTFIPLALLVYFRLRISRVPSFIVVWFVLFLLQIVLYIGANFFYSKDANVPPLRTDFPGNQLAQKLYRYWHIKSNRPLEYVIGDTWVAGNTAFYSPEVVRPHVWIDGKNYTSQWINPIKVKQAGAILVWVQKEDEDYVIPRHLVRKFPTAQLGDRFKLSWRKHPGDLIFFGWAYLPPSF